MARKPSDATLARLLDGGASPRTRERIDRWADECASGAELLGELGRLYDRSGSPPSTLGISAGGREYRVGSTIGRYQLLRLVGRGGMGMVYEAYDPQLSRRVAFKLLRSARDPEDHARLLREARLMASVAHPHVLEVYDVGRDPLTPFIVMPLVQGGDLRQWLSAEHRGWRSIVAMFIGAGRGLAAAHGVGVVHRDFKPSNVLIDPSGEALVADFGLALERPADCLSPTLTEHDTPRSVEGTPAYMAPEQITAEPATPASDQFGFCVALYEALVGHRPFDGHDVDSLLRAMGGRPSVPARARVPRRVAEIVLRGLRVDPRDRWPSMAELVDALERASARRTARWVGLCAVVAVAGLALVDIEPGVAAAGCEPETLQSVVWNDARRARLEASFERAAPAHGRQAWGYTRRPIAQRVEAWQDAAIEVCGAGSLDPRWSCLMNWRNQLDGLLEGLEQPDAEQALAAPAAAWSLLDPRACLHPDAAPSSGSPRARRLAEQLAHAMGMIDAGQLEVGRDAVLAIVEQAHAMGLERLEAQASFIAGRVHDELGDLDEARRRLPEAFWKASELGAHELAAEAALTAAQVAIERSDVDEASEWLEHAAAMLQRRGDRAGDDRLQLQWSYKKLSLQQLSRDRIAVEDSCWELLDRPELPEPLAGTVLHQLALSLRAQGRHEEALDAFERARVVLGESLGPGHADVATVLAGMALTHYDAFDFDSALRYFERARAIRVLLYDEDDWRVAAIDLSMGMSLVSSLRPQEGIAVLQHAHRVLEAELGPTAPMTLTAVMGLAFAFRDLEQAERGLEAIGRAEIDAPDFEGAGAAWAELWWIKGALLADLGQTEAAVEALHGAARAAAVDEDPTPNSIGQRIARTLERVEQGPEVPLRRGG